MMAKLISEGAPRRAGRDGGELTGITRKAVDLGQLRIRATVTIRVGALDRGVSLPLALVNDGLAVLSTEGAASRNGREVEEDTVSTGLTRDAVNLGPHNV